MTRLYNDYWQRTETSGRHNGFYENFICFLNRIELEYRSYLRRTLSWALSWALSCTPVPGLIPGLICYLYNQTLHVDLTTRLQVPDLVRDFEAFPC